MGIQISDQRAGIHLQRWVVGLGVVLMLIKGLAWLLTGSNAILSDTLESVVNVGAGSFTLYGLRRAMRPADDRNPFGHGRMEVLTALFEGWFVLLAGGLIAWRAVEALLAGSEVHRITVGILLTTVAGTVNMAMGMALRRQGRASGSLALEAGGLHLMSDAWSTVAMLGGLALIAVTGLQWVDAVLAFAFGIFILWQGARVLGAASRRVLDSREPALHRLVQGLLNGRNGLARIELGHVRVANHGNTLLVDMPVAFPAGAEMVEAAAELRTLESELSKGTGRTVQLRVILYADASNAGDGRAVVQRITGKEPMWLN